VGVASLLRAGWGMSTPAAFGLAMALPNRKVLSLDADGNLLLNLGVLGTVANENPTNLTILVMDNRNYLGSHKKEPGMPTATGGKNKIHEVAKRCGMEKAWGVYDVPKFCEKNQASFLKTGAPFITPKINTPHPHP